VDRGDDERDGGNRADPGRGQERAVPAPERARPGAERTWEERERQERKEVREERKADDRRLAPYRGWFDETSNIVR